MKRSKRMLPAVALMVGSLLLAACGGDGDTPEPTTPGSDDGSTGDSGDSGDQGDASGDTLPVLADLSDEDRAYVEDLIEQASGEGGELWLNWQYYDDIMDDWEAGFNEMYGLDINIIHTPNPDGSGGSSQVTEEVGAGRTPHSDIVQGLNARLNNSIKAGVPIAYGDEWLHMPHVGEESLESDGQVVVYSHVIPGIAYNPQTVAEEDVPRNAWDVINNGLLDKYAVAATPTASLVDSLFTQAVDQDIWGWDRACDFTRQLGLGVSGLINSGETDRIASGEFDMLVFDTGQQVLGQKAAGMNIEQAYLADALFLRPAYFAVPTGAEHEATARLFIDYLLSPGAQEILYNTYYVDHLFVDGSRSRPAYDEIIATGAEPAVLDIAIMDTISDEADDHLSFLARELIRGAEADCGNPDDFGM